MNDFESYLAAVDLLRAEYPDQRPGQAAFNALFRINPTLADKIWGGELDPFYRDVRLPYFYGYIKRYFPATTPEGETP